MIRFLQVRISAIALLPRLHSRLAALPPVPRNGRPVSALTTSPSADAMRRTDVHHAADGLHRRGVRGVRRGRASSSTEIHEKFKELVERLLTDFLAEMGISVDQFSEVIQRSKHAELNEFVLASINGGRLSPVQVHDGPAQRRPHERGARGARQGKSEERNARAIAIQNLPAARPRVRTRDAGSAGAEARTRSPTDPGVDDQGFHLGAVEQAMKASRSSREGRARAAGGSRRGSHRRCASAAMASATTGDATGM